jgi:hypothetical protein
VHPDRRSRAAFRSTLPQPVEPRTAHVDYLLSFLIARSSARDDGTQSVGARLDALEHTLANLTRPWRADSPIAPARELRVSNETLSWLLAWLEDGGRADRAAIERLGVYASGALTNRHVPLGWVRVQLG